MKFKKVSKPKARLHIDLDPKLKAKAEATAIEEDVSLTALVIAALEEYMKDS